MAEQTSQRDGVVPSPAPGLSVEGSSVSPLGGRAARGGTLVLLGQAWKVALQLASLVVLGRLLTPGEFGIVAAVSAVIGVCDVLRDFGLSTAAVQAKQLSQTAKSNLFWINTGLGLLLTVVVAAASPLVARIYSDPRVTSVCAVLSVSFFLSGVQTQFQAELTRRLRFSALVWSEFAALSLAFVVTIAAAAWGAGYWSLVLQQVANVGALCGLRIWLSRWSPSRPGPCAGEMRPLLRYGYHLTGTQLLVFVSSNVDSVLVGRRFGPDVLGLYNRAFQLLTAPLNQFLVPVTNVALPVLSQMQDDTARLLRYVQRAQISLGYCAVFTFVIIATFSDDFVGLLLGPKWQAAAPLLAVFALGGAVQAVSYPTYWVYLAKGLTARQLKFTLVSRVLVVVAILLGSRYGVHGVAVAYAASTSCTWPASLWWLSRSGVRGTTGIFLSGLRILAVGGAVALVLQIVRPLLALQEHLVAMGFAVLLALVVGAFLAALIPAVRADARDITGTVRLLRGQDQHREQKRGKVPTVMSP